MSKPVAAIVEGPVPSPWWRVGAMWLVLGGPLVVVLASLVTAAIAFGGADVVLNDGRAAAPTRDGNTAAISARNHAATPAR